MLYGLLFVAVAFLRLFSVLVFALVVTAGYWFCRYLVPSLWREYLNSRRESLASSRLHPNDAGNLVQRLFTRG